jgi:hypothetical protein
MGEARRKKAAREAMQFYHFTHRRYLDAIEKEGLRPGQSTFDPRDVVWLTTNPETIFAADQYGNLLENAHDCRISLIIPLYDPRLINWGRWLRKHMPGDVEHYSQNPYLGRERSCLTLQQWFCYFGTVPTSCFREIMDPRERRDRVVSGPSR